MRHRALITVLSVAILAFSAASIAGAQKQLVGNLLLEVTAKLSPKKLPREGLSPVAVSIGWKITQTDGADPPKLKQIQIEINRQGHFDLTGLPDCPYAKIQPASTSRALRNCRSSVVGKGDFSSLVGLEGQERYFAKGRMAIFKSSRNGRPVLLGQLYSARPFSNSFVIVFKLSSRPHGEYGTTMTAALPANLLAWGNLTEVNMTLSREYGGSEGRRSILSASCSTPAGIPETTFRLARTGFLFADGPDVRSTLSETCKVRH